MDRIRFLVRFFVFSQLFLLSFEKKKNRYDREKQTQMFIQKLQLLVSMGPPGGGRNVITNRLLTKFNVINMTFPAEKQIMRIYGSMLHHHISEFHSEVKGIGIEMKDVSLEGRCNKRFDLKGAFYISIQPMK